jgi:hypothetical protein
MPPQVRPQQRICITTSRGPGDRGLSCEAKAGARAFVM